MGLNERYQRKAMEGAQHILGDRARVLDHASGSAGPHPLLAIGGMVVGVIVMFALTKVLVGGLLIIGIGQVLNKPRNVALTDEGLAVFKKSPFTSKPVALIGMSDRTALVAGAGQPQAGFTPVTLGTERVWVRQKDLERMTAPGTATA